MGKFNMMKALEDYSNELVDVFVDDEDLFQIDETMADDDLVIEGSQEIALLSQALDHQIGVGTALVEMQSVLTQTPELSRLGASVVETAIESLINSVNIKTQPLPAMECFGTTMSRVDGTKALAVALEGVIGTVWQAIKDAFKKMYELVKKVFVRMFSGIDRLKNQCKDTVLSAEEFEKIAKEGKILEIEPTLAIESFQEGITYLTKPFKVVAHAPGAYLGDDKHELEKYIHNVSKLDTTILTLVKTCGEGFGITKVNIGSLSGEFRTPNTHDQLNFVKERLRDVSSQVRTMQLPFDKGFIWYVDADAVKAGVQSKDHNFNVYNLDCLTIPEIKQYMLTLGEDLSTYNNESNKLATAITKDIHTKIETIESLLKQTDSDDQRVAQHRHELKSAHASLESLKAIEFGFYQFKSRTTAKIKHYCELSISQRKKEYSKIVKDYANK